MTDVQASVSAVQPVLFEEVAAHFGYSLGVGAIPVKKFAYRDKRRDGSKQRHEVVLPANQIKLSPRMYHIRPPVGKDVTAFWQADGRVRDWVRFELAWLWAGPRGSRGGATS